MALTLVTAPAAEPVTLAEAKVHLRVDVTDDDSLINALITAARQYAEVFQGRAFVTQTWDLTLDEWPDGAAIEVPRPPLQSVTSITYKDKDGTSTTMAASDYIVDTKSEPGRIVLAYGKSWPSATLYPAGAVTVQFTAGYGAASAVPEKVKAAIKLLVGHWYEQRESIVVGRQVIEVPMTVEALLWQDRVFVF